LKLFKYMGIGDWGLGIGDWGLGPIPNPQSPLKYVYNKFRINIFNYIFYLFKNYNLNIEQIKLIF